MISRHSRHAIAVTALVAFTAAPTLAQTPQPAAPLTAGRALNQMYTTIKTYLSESAAKMPDVEFAFKPSADVRSYGELLGHVSNAGFSTCAGMLGEESPNKENLEKKAAKPEVGASLTAMFAYCDRAFAALTDDSASELLKMGQRQVARSVVATNLLVHLNEHYGNAVTYMRMKGIVPPSTERAMKR